MTNRSKYRQIGLNQFQTALAMKESWFLEGHRLLRCAEVLLEQLWIYKRKAEPLMKKSRSIAADDPEFEIIERSLMEPAISMIVGYALENLLKGLWVAQNPEKVKSAFNLPKELTQDSGHDLNRLCVRTGLTIIPAEREFLRVLSEFSRWRGRYSIDRTAERNADAWENADNLRVISSKYPGPLGWPDELVSVIAKVEAKVKEGISIE